MKGAIVAGSIDAAEAGSEIFRIGGNAIDAAVAATYASFVSEMMISAIGGGGFAIVDVDDVVKVYDFYCNSPGIGLHSSKSDSADFSKVRILFEDMEDYEYVGRGSSAVFGNPAGLEKLIIDHGTLPLERILAPAIRLANNGVSLSKQQANLIHLSQFVLGYTPKCSSLFSRDGHLLKKGDLFRAEELAKTLHSLATEGSEICYTGDIARKIVKDHLSNKGLITTLDLTRYEVNVCQPISLNYLDHYSLYTNPRPSISGQIISSSLGNKEVTTDHVIEWVKGINNSQDREMGLFFEDFFEDKSKSRLIKKKIASNTTHISAIDQSGNSIGITVSAGASAGYLIDNTGILMNNILGEPQLHPKGYHMYSPGKRLPSMMAPTIVKGQNERLVLGSAGASRISTAILQVIKNIFEKRLNLKSAIEHPRIHYENGVLDIERGAFPQDQFDSETTRYWSKKSMYFGGVNAVMMKGNKFTAHADSRRGGHSVIVN